uniref:Uncharacterized protein n=1 Tax=viral metagenome TaxID=1070528 RepID=A0A6H1ZBP1_9ZZZZ
MEEEKQPTGMIVNATRSQIESFKESILWQDINRELDFWTEGFAREQDAIVDNASSNNPSTAAVLLHYGDINGRKKAVNYFAQILDVFLDVLEEKKDDIRYDETA